MKDRRPDFDLGLSPQLRRAGNAATRRASGVLRARALNRQMWKAILARTDDDRVWIPGPQQEHGVIAGMPRPDMIKLADKSRTKVALAAVRACLQGGERERFATSIGLISMRLRTLMDNEDERRSASPGTRQRLVNRWRRGSR
jgi:hypothetical protein